MKGWFSRAGHEKEIKTRAQCGHLWAGHVKKPNGLQRVNGEATSFGSFAFAFSGLEGTSLRH